MAQANWGNERKFAAVCRTPRPSVDAHPFFVGCLDAYGDYTARWGRVLMGSMLLRLYLGRLTVPRLTELYTAIDTALDGADLLVTHPTAALIGRIAAENRGIPWISGDLFPMLTPTVHHPPPLVPRWKRDHKLARAYHRAMWRLSTSPMARWMSSERAFVEFRAGHGLTTEAGYVVLGRLSPQQNVVLVSNHYVAPAPDWDSKYPMCGFTFWTGSDQSIGPDVEAFLNAGDAPVLVTLGTSAAAGDPQVFVRVARVLDALGLRGLYLTSNDANGSELRDRPGVWPYLPLEAILPRVRAVVHSGSHGTNALVLAAGKPSVIVPHLFDQVWHGKRQVDLGTGLMVARRFRKERQLKAALQRVTRDASFARVAEEFAAKLASEDGAAAACAVIEEFLGGYQPGTDASFDNTDSI
jgi:rhamnosyltransferase subunit B